MAKEDKNKQGDIERSLDNLNISLEGILAQYKVLSKKEKRELLKKLKRREKILVKNWFKNQTGMGLVEIKTIQARVKTIENLSERIYINYGIVEFHVNINYLKKLKDKERYLDHLFSRKLKTILNHYPAPTSMGEAKQLEGLITQYHKKLATGKSYDAKLVCNNVFKLTNFRNKFNPYEYSPIIEALHETCVIGDPEEVEEVNIDGLYKAIVKPLLIDNYLVGLQFNFF